LDKLILISAEPNRLHIYDPVSQQDRQMELDSLATAVSVSPDGRFAAVSQPEQILLVNLESNSIEKTWPTPSDISEVVLADEWLYYSLANGAGTIFGQHLSDTATVSTTLASPSPHAMAVAPDGRSLYTTSRGPSPSQLEKIDVRLNEMRFMYDSGAVADTCGEVWLAADGRYAFTGCGYILRLADQRQNDMVLIGNLLAEPQKITALTHAANAGLILLMTETADAQVLFVGDEDHALMVMRSLPASLHGRYLFANTAGTQYYVITQSNEGPYGLFVDDVPSQGE
jgi:hypothetical protein